MELPYRGGDDEKSGDNANENGHENELGANGNAGMMGSNNGDHDGSGAENRLYNGYQGSLMEPGDNSVPHDSYDRSFASNNWNQSIFVVVITITSLVSQWLRVIKCEL